MNLGSLSHSVKIGSDRSELCCLRAEKRTSQKWPDSVPPYRIKIFTREPLMFCIVWVFFKMPLCTQQFCSPSTFTQYFTQNQASQLSFQTKKGNEVIRLSSTFTHLLSSFSLITVISEAKKKLERIFLGSEYILDRLKV